LLCKFHRMHYAQRTERSIETTTAWHIGSGSSGMQTWRRSQRSNRDPLVHSTGWTPAAGRTKEQRAAENKRN
jgi:hypothetical protein